MRTPHIVLLLTGLVVFFSQSSSGHDESSWHPILYDYYHIDLTELGGYQDGGAPEPDEGGFGGNLPVPKDAIVDAINELGIKLLAIHNEHNENNIAISPYGAFSVLAALSEGLEGAAALEVLHAAHIPKEKSIIRIGLRDIHRHLKSYFIPEEGFLAGLTLNLNNVSLKSDYEEVLRFYGFDYSSFNNALYPEPPTTKKEPPAEGTTLETGLGVSEAEATTATNRPAEEATVTVEEETTAAPTTTEATVSTTMENQVTTGKGNNPAAEEPTSSTEAPTTIAVETTTRAEETSASPASTTTEGPITEPPTTVAAATASVVTSSETTIVQILETQSSTDKNSEFHSTSFKETISTSFSSHSTSESTDNTGKDSTDAAVTVSTTETVGADSATEATTMLTGNTLRTTRDATFQSEDPDIPSATEVATTTITEVVNEPAEEPFLTTTLEIPSSSDAAEEMATSTVAPIATEPTFLSVIDMGNEIAATSMSAEFSDAPETTTQVFAATDLNYNYEAAEAYEDNAPMSDGAGEELNPSLKRSARSVVDYVIARIYDDRPRYLPLPPRPQYAANEPLTFAIYGKYREGGINFMKYDTVLPYYFVHKLNAAALSFPLDSTKYYLLLLLPLRDAGIDQLICDLRIHGSLRHIIDNLKLTHVVATIPSFMLKGYVTLTPTLQRLGVRSIFEPRQADFSAMTNVSDIYVTNIEQAVTVTIRNYLDSSAQRYKNFRRFNPVRFKADHPFLYFVVDSELHVALMVGKVINPLNSRIS
ncbi:hypothetical protein HUJ04_005897 [Dendroctonus ponderosae]|uniref:Serpin domain-containing protein n=1 Tax=Dendroctonus ponderosae TaxID=77166 RepID=A0AAR5Q3F1_DENPD|nr:hypothetical protein HUJ04_005897 [Dendroctonus ponderosae]